MNTLQVIVYLPLINFRFPANAVLGSLVFMDISNFDIVPHEWINSRVFNFSENFLIRVERFQTLGFEQRNFITNTGSAIWMFAFWLLGMLLGTGLKLWQKTENIGLKILSTYQFGFLIRILFETYFDNFFCGLINMN